MKDKLFHYSYFFILLLFLAATSTFAQFSPKNGDLFFQEGKINSFTKAVQTVTKGYHGAQLSHVGMLFYENGIPYIAEATDKVRIIPLDKFLKRSVDKNGNPRVLVGRVKEKYKKLIPKAIEIVISLKGLPYNDNFDINNNNAFYCSQLIYYCFMKANNDNTIFKLHPMTFKKPGTENILPIWKQYFNKLKQPVPEGVPGLNPGGMSLSKNISIIHVYGKINGIHINKNKKPGINQASLQ